MKTIKGEVHLSHAPRLKSESHTSGPTRQWCPKSKPKNGNLKLIVNLINYKHTFTVGHLHMMFSFLKIQKLPHYCCIKMMECSLMAEVINLAIVKVNISPFICC